MLHAPAPIQPVLLGMRVALHAMVASLAVFVIVRSALEEGGATAWSIALGIVLLISYGAGALLLRATTGYAVRIAWLAIVTLEILGLTFLTPDGAFLVFPLFFLQLHLLAPWPAVGAVMGTVAVAILELARHGGWNIGGVAGPLIGAAVAIVIGLGYRALYRETRERQRLIDELHRTRDELAQREREAGVLSERSRLAREIHDTVAQGLASIQLLLHAAEREGASVSALESIRLARETAAQDLTETRRIIRELAPGPLEGRSLTDALARLAKSSRREGLRVSFTASGDPFPLPMALESTLLRIAQASLANVVQHSGASRAELTLTWLGDWVGLDIVDDGRGFEVRTVDKTETFGLRALRERVRELGGNLEIETAPGDGTAIAVSFAVQGEP